MAGIWNLVLIAGNLVFARLEDSGEWCHAKVLRADEGGYVVLFRDYGIKMDVARRDIVNEVHDIPEGEALDIHIETLLKNEKSKKVAAGRIQRWSVGNDCVARWVEDGKWYNAIVDRILER